MYDDSKKIARRLVEAAIGVHLSKDGIAKFKQLAPSERDSRLCTLLTSELIPGEPPYSCTSLIQKRKLVSSLMKLLNTDREQIITIPELFVFGPEKGEGVFELLDPELRFYQYTTKRHRINQDRVVSIIPKINHLFQVHAVFDGVSGCDDGTEASWIASQMLESATLLGLVKSPEDIPRVLNWIHDNLNVYPDLTTTATIAFVSDTNIHIFQVGDSPAFVFAYRQDTYSGRIMLEPCFNHSYLGDKKDLEITTGVSSFRRGVIVLLASDGFLPIFGNPGCDKETCGAVGQRIWHSEHLNFCGFGPSIRQPIIRSQSLDGSTHHVTWGPPDDASVILICGKIE